jgi:hypothetical protein
MLVAVLRGCRIDVHAADRVLDLTRGRFAALCMPVAVPMSPMVVAGGAVRVLIHAEAPKLRRRDRRVPNRPMLARARVARPLYRSAATIEPGNGG